MLRGMKEAIVQLLFWIFTVSSLGYWLFGWFLTGKLKYLPFRDPVSPSALDETGRRLQTERAWEDLRDTISVIIPARNEEGNLGNLLASLAVQRIPAAQIVVVDDHSVDTTAEVAHRFGAELLSAPELPEGWTGKSWACYTGAERARGEKLLFIDADVVLEEDALERLAEAGSRYQVVSVQPYHRTERFYESLSAFPNLVVLSAIGPFGLFTADNLPKGLFGPVIYVDRELYRRSGGHKEVASSVVEDIELAKLFIRNGGVPAVYAGGGAISFRMYPGGIDSLKEGWRKNLSSGSEHSYPQTRIFLSLWIAGIVNSMLAWAAATYVGTALVGGASFLLWLLYVLQVALLLRPVGRFGPLPSLLYPLYFAWFLYLVAGSRRRTRKTGTVRWKGRDIEIVSHAASRKPKG